ncbi:hypothetical protein BDN72DRAFT_898178 [Pluteus cervinus]|uniref:Uncharacterized protein n=1 Tax=Pluteus cervinus TaxID=181527 RepID=A0ACD3ATY5_9AGAR|nr:hypothetical protein BDN72DRAFT_898178 [Pluteus cervinus]
MSTIVLCVGFPNHQYRLNAARARFDTSNTRHQIAISAVQIWFSSTFLSSARARFYVSDATISAGQIHLSSTFLSSAQVRFYAFDTRNDICGADLVLIHLQTVFVTHNHKQDSIFIIFKLIPSQTPQDRVLYAQLGLHRDIPQYLDIKANLARSHSLVEWIALQRRTFNPCLQDSLFAYSSSPMERIWIYSTPLDDIN